MNINKEKESLDYIKKFWNNYPLNRIYRTCNNNSILLNSKNSFYVYSKHRVDCDYKLLELNSLYFKAYKFLNKDFGLPIGYVFFISIPNKNYKIRYTENVLAVTNNQSTYENVHNAERRTLYSDDSIDIKYLSCGVELVTNLSSKLKCLVR